ncbi:MAG: hypothetical protein UY23_C0006G0050 [Candidatus Jorgensenbacteria bacterium GW2011_GWA1_48_11]|uniref:Uncharacterized protein n=1 Tax=Candidatus Jorgensenbacteria bacterium GW2011_GWA1_48_11 TaxID=1618660 RepID=A0A0G1U9L4_9BACT|nr:MAG: hypothetical protein UY23_C0006G0050 [Candidatus Jorgensenbacteria bacterium GW2011_GWA1_48_11]KKW12379.1 MAG: hypothetical protein UY51_C0005G0621 [Candidatus Jorgensenbacteria bacterium GW2011_GWB1_49_9]
MSEHPLEQKFGGSLRVIIRTLGGETHEFTPQFVEGSLFDYVGHACACIFTNMTTQLSVAMRPDDWIVIRFSCADRILEVQQIGGEPLVVQKDDTERLAALGVPYRC